MASQSDASTTDTLHPGSGLVILIAAAAGTAVANLYYAQPLLDSLARGFDIDISTAGLIVTLTQLGYAAGLCLLVPLGDLLERRRLITVVTVATALALAGAALSPTIGAFLMASLAIGLTAVVAQVLVPFAAHLADDIDRGRVVGQVMTGLLLGILLARTVSGFIADLLGWRAVFWLAAALMIAQALILHRALPAHRGESRLGYPTLLLSVLHLLRDEPLLRRRIVYGAMGMGAFSVFWTALPFLLARPPYGYSDTVIGLFGLLGAAGALCASFAGRLHDRGHSRPGTGAFLLSLILAFVVMGLFGHHLAAIILGVILLDIGQQGAQILNQSTIYQLRPDARSRITTAYMTCFFLGGVVGSAIAAYTFEHAGWPGVTAVGAGFGLVAFAFWLTELPLFRAAGPERSSDA